MWNLKTRLTLISSFDCKYILVSGAAQHLIIIHSRRLRSYSLTLDETGLQDDNI